MASAEFDLYFHSESAAREAAARLAQDAFDVTVLPGATEDDWEANDKTSWLVLGTRTVADGDEVDRLDAALEQLASDLGGTYGGFSH